MDTIVKLNLQDEITLDELWSLQHKAYRLEAEIIGFRDIPPLLETRDMLSRVTEEFYGCFDETEEPARRCCSHPGVSRQANRYPDDGQPGPFPPRRGRKTVRIYLCPLRGDGAVYRIYGEAEPSGSDALYQARVHSCRVRRGGSWSRAAGIPPDKQAEMTSTSQFRKEEYRE